MQKSYKKWVPIFLAPVCVMFLFQYAIPLCTVVSTSFTEYKLTAKGVTFIGLQNYIDLFTKDPTFVVALKNTAAWLVLHPLP